jgi:hypothetical protein
MGNLLLLPLLLLCMLCLPHANYKSANRSTGGTTTALTI